MAGQDAQLLLHGYLFHWQEISLEQPSQTLIALRNLLSPAGDAREDSRGTTKENLDPCMFARPQGYEALCLKLSDFANFGMRIDGEYDHFWLSKTKLEVEHGGHVKQRSGLKAKLTPPDQHLDAVYSVDFRDVQRPYF